MELKKIGAEVSVVLLQEALSAIVKNKSDFSPLLREDREKILENLKKKGLLTNSTELIKAARNSGVKFLLAQCGLKFWKSRENFPQKLWRSVYRI